MVVAAASVVAYQVVTRSSTAARQFLDFGAGVLALVCLTSAVMWGLTAADRLLLYSNHRLAAQSVHRILAVAGLVFLFLHIWIKVTEGHASALAAVVPFVDADQPVLIGLGTLAGLGFLGVAVTGALRTKFTSRRGALVWRGLHMLSYLAWGASLVHGLKSGRAGKDWVTVAYAACLVVVALTLILKVRSADRLPSTTSPGPAAGGPSRVPPQQSTEQSARQEEASPGPADPNAAYWGTGT
ncbi:hypothetical protein [Kitasatospora sp. NPDC059827]|uniref:hypothetical protein n=1 Tax=Kitasatospora sp. NPDC059827 TaxID=3346964 RepID=UPI00365C97F7